MNAQSVVVAVGPSGAGKSTVLKQLANDQKAAYLSLDEIRLELCGSEADQSRNLQAVDLFYVRLKGLLGHGTSVVIDNTNVVPAYRQRIVQVCQEYGVKEIYMAYFNTSLEECMRRAEERHRNGGRYVPAHVIRDMFSWLTEHPVNWKAEGFTSRFDF